MFLQINIQDKMASNELHVLIWMLIRILCLANEVEKRMLNIPASFQ